MGNSRSLKIEMAPPFWAVPRKGRKWVVKPSPGPHAIERSMPLLIVLRDILKYAETGREARKIINEGKIKVDGRPVKDYKYPIGVMDVIEIPETGEYYRVVPYPTYYLKLHEITAEESRLKPVRIQNKTTLKGGKLQINCYGGRNILLKGDEAQKLSFKTLDTLLISLPEQEIIEHIPFKIGNIAIITWGKNVGKVGRLVSVNRQWGWRRSIVTLEGKGGKQIQTTLDYILILGEEKPSISIPGELMP